jgi:hypothetical protein
VEYVEQEEGAHTMTTRCPNLRTQARACPPDCAFCHGTGAVQIVTACELIAEIHSRQRNIIHVPELVGILGELVQRQKGGGQSRP